MIIYDKDRQIIDGLIGRRNAAQRFTDSIKQSSNLKGVSQAILELNLDTNQQRIGVNYIYTTASSRLFISQIEPKINLTLINYLDVALYFINNINILKSSIKTMGKIH